MLFAPKGINRFSASTSGFLSEFLGLTERLSRLALMNGVHLEPYLDRSLPIFSRVSVKRRFEIVTSLQTYVHVAASVASERGGRVETIPFLKAMIQRLGLVAAPDLYEIMTADSLVEIYSFNSGLTFKNFKSFEFCSYTLEELLAQDWWRLYHRAEDIDRKISLWGRRVLNGEIRETCVPPIPQHTVVERESRRRLCLKVNHDYYSPLFQYGKIAAGVSIARARIFMANEISPRPAGYCADLEVS